MSSDSLDRSNNNKCKALVETLSTHQRDGRYYYPDGSAVFLVDKVLFKLQASLIFGRKFKTPRLDDYNGNNSTYPMYLEDLPAAELARSSDNNPVILSNITARQFRNFLLVAMGLPDDKEYMELLEDFHHPKKCESYRRLVQYLDIACLSRRFGRIGLEDWARKALYPVLDKSKYQLASRKWDMETLLQLRSFTCSSFNDSEPLKLSAITFIDYFLVNSARRSNVADVVATSGRDICVRLYTDPTLRSYDPALFGCVFAIILSLGYRYWDTHLSGKVRTVLYTAQVQLAAQSSLNSLNWFLEPKPADQLLPTCYFRICDPCEERFMTVWKENFGACQGLKSGTRTTADSIVLLTQLPQFRKSLVSQWEDYRSCSTSGHDGRGGGILSVLGVGSPKCSYPDSCPSGDELLIEIDQHIQQAYEEIAGQYDSFACSASDG